MDAKMKADWTAALRGGRYEQGQHRLRRQGGYCCLGVLADLACPDLWRPTPEEGVYGLQGEIDVHIGTIPGRVLERIGLTNIHQDHLIAMNDRQGRTFGEIAAWIEEILR